MNYTDVTQVFDLLQSTDDLIQITPVHLSGFVSRTSTINADGDIAPGAVNTADIQFSVLDIRGPVSSYTGREFVYRKGYAEAATREKMATAADAYVTRGGVEYYVYGTTLTATNGVTTNTYVVTKGAGALVLRGAELIVLYPDEPYAQRFTVDGTTLTDLGTPLFVYDYDKDIAAGYARQKVSYEVTDDVVTTYHAFTMFNVRYLDIAVYEVHTVGYFTFDRPKRGTGGVYTVSASDRMTAFDSDYVDVLNSVTTGTTAQQLLESLCSAAGVELAIQDRYNADLVIVVPEDLESCTGTQILTWLGELMGCSWRINAAGQLESVWFAQTATRLTRDDYVSFSYEAYMVAPIDKVLTGSAYADVVGFAGPGANALVIDQNSLLSYTEQEDLNQFSSGLLTQVATVPEYRPGTLSGYANPTISPGDVIYVDNDDDEMEPVCVTQVTESGFQLTITSSGNQRREVQNYASASLQTVKRTVEELRKQTGEFPAMWEQSIKDAVESITGGSGGTRVDLINPDTLQPSGTAYLFDSDNIDTAKKVLVINAGGIAYYDNGYNVDDPASSVPAYVVMDNNGRISANSILTGTLNAAQVNIEGLYLKATEAVQGDQFGDEIWKYGYSGSTGGGSIDVDGKSVVINADGVGSCGATISVASDLISNVVGNRVKVTVTYQILETVTISQSGSTGYITLFATGASGTTSLTLVRFAQYGSPGNVGDPVELSGELFIPKDVTRVYLFANVQLGTGSVRVYSPDLTVTTSKVTTLTLNAGTAELSSAKIDISGVVSFSDLEEQGSTVINGANVSTGTISAVRIQSADGSSYWDLPSGSLLLSGSFSCNNGVTGAGRNQASLSGGSLSLVRTISDGSSRMSAELFSTGSNASLGSLYLYGPGDGYQTVQVAMTTSFTGGSATLNRADGTNGVILDGPSGYGRFFGNLDVQGDTGLGVSRAVNCRTLYAWESKNRVVETSFGNLRMSAFETPEPTFADTGSGLCDEHGLCVIVPDPRFAETVARYKDFKWLATPTSKGSLWVEKLAGYAVIHGDPGMPFDWMCICTQRGFEAEYAEVCEEEKPKDATLSDGNLTYLENVVTNQLRAFDAVDTGWDYDAFQANLMEVHDDYESDWLFVRTDT